MKIKTYCKEYPQFDRFVFCLGPIRITYNPKYKTPSFTCRPEHNGLHQMFEDFVNQVPLKEVNIDPEKKIIWSDWYRFEYQGVFMY